MTSSLAIVVPAAGASSRMGGRDKLLELVEGVPLLTRQVGRALDTGADVFVTLRADRPLRGEALDQLPQKKLTRVPVERPQDGLSASLAAGIRALPDTVEAVMILLPDLPEIDTSDLSAMIAAQAMAPARILRAYTESGVAGHPVIFPRAWFAELWTLTGDRGAGALLRRADVIEHRLSGNRAITDLDTPEAWAAWRARTGA
ncbi:nucleotidyltransferase family protein [Roseovarius pelagicus]|uniref:Nucleotidyltransferase family protein n=1 Tax=Roseovarius pelagicus TaxID=2980108 RepID=A0ABY6DC94_9RHOB|nr:nucleotidyltransferase family protein [Roseovarius pelagicus]UXX83756.1 nucleotidyltransferase family protein [Roseovarius pelagicus]